MDSPKFKPRHKALKYGISPLHACIRFFDLILKIAYRLNLKKWQVRDENGKEEMAKQKKTIQKQMWNAMALHVDKPKQNGNGNTNDGNTARRAFAQPNLLAEILGLDEFLIAYFSNILIAISCHLPIDPTQFKKYCQKIITRYMSLYPWHYAEFGLFFYIY